MLTKEELKQIDIYAGAQVKKARKEINMSQGKLAESCGIAFQQIQKYERGTNRISISRMCQISEILEKPIWFFVPQDRGADMVKHALHLESVITRHREKEDQILTIISGS